MAKKNFDDAFSVPSSTKTTAMDKFAIVERVTEGVSAATTVDVTLLLRDVPDGEFRDWCLKHSYVPESVIELPLGDLNPSPFNPRHFYLQESIRELAADLSEQAQQQPIHVSPDYSTPGKFYIHDGGRRVRALRLNKAETARAIVKDIKLGRESYKFGYSLNTNQKTQTLFDDAIQWKHLLDEKQYESQAALAQDLNISSTRVSKVLDVAKLLPELIEKMLAYPDKFGLELAYAVSRYYRARGVQATHRLVNRIVQEDLATRDVEKLVDRQEDAKLEPTSSGRRKYDQRYDFSVAGVKAGELKTYADGTLTVTLKDLPQEFRDDLAEHLKQVIEAAGKRLEAASKRPESEEQIA
jgi:ParB family chromosome partitioning protein